MILRRLLLSFLISPNAFASYDIEVKVNGSNELQTVAGELTSVTMGFTHQQTGEKPHHFMKMHDKLMHMILVSDDLEHFAHIHPTFQHMKKSFRIDLNTQEAPDPDNLDTVKAIPAGGNYSVFTEVMPHDDDMLMVYNRFPIRATGKERRPAKDFRSISSPGEKLVKYFDEMGRETDHGAKYRVTFDFEQYQWCSWFLPKFYVLVEVWSDDSKSYTDPKDLQKWLGMGGHSILISRNEVLDDRSFYHLHALLPITTPGEFVFPYHDHQKGMDDGNYRLFMQFKHDNKVRKVYFDFEYTNPPLPEFGVLKVPLFC